MPYPSQNKKYPARPEIHLCDCGNRAFKRDGAGYVCARCANIEVQLYNKAECPTASFPEGRRDAALKYRPTYF